MHDLLRVSGARWRIALLTLGAGTLALAGCSPGPSDPIVHGSMGARLTPVTSVLPEPTVRRTVYVPVYSSIYLGVDIKQHMVQLSVTVSVRNVSAHDPVVLEFVRYYDSAGKPLRDYLAQPAELAPLATVEFVVQRSDTAGGPGANFLIGWRGPAAGDEPLIEAVMIGASGNAGFSFTSPGRVVKERLQE